MNRHDFSWLRHNKDIIFFDNAATSHKPQQVIDAMSHFYAYDYAPAYRSMYRLAEQVTAQYEKVRQQVARFINARSAAEVVFVKGATEGINAVVAAWGFSAIQEGDEIVLTAMEHHSNLLPWQWLAQQKKAVLKFIPVTPDGLLDLAQLDRIITQRTKLVAAVSTSNSLGTHNDITLLSRHARAVGAKILVDACQSAPHEITDVQALDCDFLVFSGHKLLAPTGIGVLYIKHDLHDALQPYQRGGGMVREADYYHAQWLGMPNLLEAGTQPLAQIIGLGAAINYYNEHVNFVALREHELQLTRTLIEGLLQISDVRIIGPVDELKQYGHNVSFVHERYHPHDVAAYLDSHNICVRAGHFCAQPLFKALGLPAGAVRVSFLGYNTLAEVERFLDVLKKL